MRVVPSKTIDVIDMYAGYFPGYFKDIGIFRDNYYENSFQKSANKYKKLQKYGFLFT